MATRSEGVGKVVRISLGGDLRGQNMRAANISDGAVVEYIKCTENILLSPIETNLDADMWVFKVNELGDEVPETPDLYSPAPTSPDVCHNLASPPIKVKKMFRSFCMFDESATPNFVKFEVQFLGVTESSLEIPLPFSDVVKYWLQGPRTLTLQEGCLTITTTEKSETYDMSTVDWSLSHSSTRINVLFKGRNILDWADSNTQHSKVVLWDEHLSSHRIFALTRTHLHGKNSKSRSKQAAVNSIVTDPMLRFDVTFLQIDNIPMVSGLLKNKSNIVYALWSFSGSAQPYRTKTLEAEENNGVKWRLTVPFQLPESVFIKGDPSFRLQLFSTVHAESMGQCIGECTVKFPDTMKRSVKNEAIDCRFNLTTPGSRNGSVVCSGKIIFTRGLDALSDVPATSSGFNSAQPLRDATNEINQNVFTQRIKISGPSISFGINTSQGAVVNAISQVIYYHSGYAVMLTESNFVSEVKVNGNSSYSFKLQDIRKLGPIFAAIQEYGCFYAIRVLGNDYVIERQQQITTASVYADLNEALDHTDVLPDGSEKFALELNRYVSLLEKAAHSENWRLPLRDDSTVRELVNALSLLYDESLGVPKDMLDNLCSQFVNKSDVKVVDFPFHLIQHISMLLQKLLVPKLIEHIDQIPLWLLGESAQGSRVENRIDSLCAFYDSSFKSYEQTKSFTNTVLLLMIHFEVLQVYRQPCSKSNVSDALRQLEESVQRDGPIFDCISPLIKELAGRVDEPNPAWSELKVLAGAILRSVRPVDMYQLKRSLEFARSQSSASAGVSTDLIIFDPLGKELESRPKVVDASASSSSSSSSLQQVNIHNTSNSKIKCIVARESNLPCTDDLFYTDLTALGECCYRLEFLDKAARSKYYDVLVSNAGQYHFQYQFSTVSQDSVVYVLSDEAVAGLNAQFQLSVELLKKYLKKVVNNNFDDNDLLVLLHYWNELPAFEELSSFISSYQFEKEAIRGTFKLGMNSWRRVVTEKLNLYQDCQLQNCDELLADFAKPFAAVGKVDPLHAAFLPERAKSPLHECVLEIIRLQGILLRQCNDAATIPESLQSLRKMNLLVNYFSFADSSTGNTTEARSVTSPVMRLESEAFGVTNRDAADVAELLQKGVGGINLVDILTVKTSEAQLKLWQTLTERAEFVVHGGDVLEAVTFMCELEEFIDFMGRHEARIGELNVFEFFSRMEEELYGVISAEFAQSRDAFLELSNIGIVETRESPQAVCEHVHACITRIQHVFDLYRALLGKGLNKVKTICARAAEVVHQIEQNWYLEIQNCESILANDCTVESTIARELAIVDQADLVRVENPSLQESINASVKLSRDRVFLLFSLDIDAVNILWEQYFSLQTTGKAELLSHMSHDWQQTQLKASLMPNFSELRGGIQVVENRIASLFRSTRDDVAEFIAVGSELLDDTASIESIMTSLHLLLSLSPFVSKETGLGIKIVNLCDDFVDAAVSLLKGLLVYSSFPTSLVSVLRICALHCICSCHLGPVAVSSADGTVTRMTLNREVLRAATAATLSTGFRVAYEYRYNWAVSQFRAAADEHNETVSLSSFKELLNDYIAFARNFLDAKAKVQAINGKLTLRDDAWSDLNESILVTIPGEFLSQCWALLSQYSKNLIAGRNLSQISASTTLKLFFGIESDVANEIGSMSELYVLRDRLTVVQDIATIFGEEFYLPQLSNEFNEFMKRLNGSIDSSLQGLPLRLKSAWDAERFSEVAEVLGASGSLTTSHLDIFRDELKRLISQLKSELQQKQLKDDVVLGRTLTIIRCICLLSRICTACAAFIDAQTLRECSFAAAERVLASESNSLLMQLQTMPNDRKQLASCFAAVTNADEIKTAIDLQLQISDSSGMSAGSVHEHLQEISAVLYKCILVKEYLVGEVEKIKVECKGALESLKAYPTNAQATVVSFQNLHLKSCFAVLDVNVQTEIAVSFQGAVNELIESQSQHFDLSRGQQLLEFLNGLFAVLPAELKAIDSLNALSSRIEEANQQRDKFLLNMVKSLKSIEVQLKNQSNVGVGNKLGAPSDIADRQTVALQSLVSSWAVWKLELAAQPIHSESMATTRSIFLSVIDIIQQLTVCLVEENNEKAFLAALAKSMGTLQALQLMDTDICQDDSKTLLGQVFAEKNVVHEFLQKISSRVSSFQTDLCAKLRELLRKLEPEISLDGAAGANICSKAAEIVKQSRKISHICALASNLFGFGANDSNNNTSNSSSMSSTPRLQSAADELLGSFLSGWIKCDLSEEALKSNTDNEIVTAFKKLCLQVNILSTLHGQADLPYAVALIERCRQHAEDGVEQFHRQVLLLLSSRSSPAAIEELAVGDESVKATADLVYQRLARSMFYLTTIGSVFGADECWWSQQTSAAGESSRSLTQPFKGLGQRAVPEVIGDIESKFKKEFLSKVQKCATDYIAKYRDATSDQAFKISESIVNILLELWFLSESHLCCFSDTIFSAISFICSQLQQLRSSKRISELYELLTGSSSSVRSGVGLSLVRKLPLFARYVLRAENKLRNLTSEDDLFTHLRLIRRPGFNVEAKKAEYRGYLHDFYREWTELVQRGKKEMKTIHAELVNDVHVKVFQLLLKHPHIKPADSFEVVRAIILKVFVMWTLLYTPTDSTDADGDDDRDVQFMRQPHRGQVLSLLLLFDGIRVRIVETLSHSPEYSVSAQVDNHFVQIGTGEGKSVTLAVAALVFALLGMNVDCSCYSTHLCERDYASFFNLFRAFGMQEAIVYQTFNKQCESFVKQKLQAYGGLKTVVNDIINTGRIPPARAKHTNATEEYEIAFGKRDAIVSQTKQIAASVEAARNDTSPRAKFQRFSYDVLKELKGKKPKVDTFADTVEKFRNFKRFLMHMERNRVLLMDEADMFFADSFYGGTLPFSHSVFNASFAKLLVNVWFEADRLKTPADIISSTEFTELEVDACWNELMQVCAFAMVRDRELVRSGRGMPYVWDEVGWNVRYRGNDGAYTDSLVLGYQTAFAFIKESKLGSSELLSQFSNKLSLELRGGELSYTEIPAKYIEFGCVVGVSGTLDTLTPAQLKCLSEKYNLDTFSFMPCTYGINRKIKFLEDCVYRNVNADGSSQLMTRVHARSPSTNGGKLSGVTVACGNEDVWFDAITTEIIGRLIDNQQQTVLSSEGAPVASRGVLVFFETDELLARYEQSKKLHRIYEFDCTADNIKVLNSAVTNTKSVAGGGQASGVNANARANIIKRACQPKFVTLCTREFGRGEDFIVDNRHLVDAGGLHVIQTFLSDEISEEIQVRGRTGRQDNPGSFSLVLPQASLEGTDLRSSQTDVMLYQELNKLREARFQRILDTRAAKLPKALTRHTQTLEFISNILNNNIRDVVRFLETENRPPIIKPRVSRTCVLIDATKSMQPLMNCVNQTVETLLEKVDRITRDAANAGAGTGVFDGAPPGKILMQFVIYRNYNDGVDRILQASEWTSDASRLLEHLRKYGKCEGGGSHPRDFSGREAIEVALQFVNQQRMITTSSNSNSSSSSSSRTGGHDGDDDTIGGATQVILIGDASYNSPPPSNLSEAFKARFPTSTTTLKEVKLLADHHVPVHVFHVKESASTSKVASRFAPAASSAAGVGGAATSTESVFENEFRGITNKTKGTYCSLMQSEDPANKANFMRNAGAIILSDVEKDADKARLMIEQFNADVQALALSSS